MTFTPQYSYKIAVGYNQPSGSLVNIETIRPSGDIRNFYAPEAYSAYNPGTPRYRLDGQNYNTGFPSTQWKFRNMTRLQYQYMRSQYCIGGGYSGTVTIQSTDQNGTQTRYNAIIQVPRTNELQRNFTAYTDVVISFIRLSTPS